MATVLVVDDIASQRALAGGLVSRQPGWQVAFAANGKEALACLSTKRADIVLTDLLMPEMNGLELLREVNRLYPEIPVVLMTASGSEDIAIRALDEGAASYVPKRVLAQKLIKTLDSVMAAIDERQLHSELSRHLTLHEFNFVLENNLALLLGVPIYLKPHLLNCPRLENLVRLRMHVALEEALVNALYHGNMAASSEMRAKSPYEFAKLIEARCKESPYSQRRIFVRVSITPDEIQFVIRDEGNGFDPATLPDATDTANLDLAHGRGITLMRAFMHEVRFSEAGNEVTMIRRLGAPCASSAIENLPAAALQE